MAYRGLVPISPKTTPKAASDNFARLSGFESFREASDCPIELLRLLLEKRIIAFKKSFRLKHPILSPNSGVRNYDDVPYGFEPSYNKGYFLGFSTEFEDSVCNESVFGDKNVNKMCGLSLSAARNLGSI